MTERTAEENCEYALKLGILKRHGKDKYLLGHDFCTHVGKHLASVDREFYKNEDGYAGLLRSWKNPPKDEEMHDMAILCAAFVPDFIEQLFDFWNKEGYAFTEKANKAAGVGT